MRITAQNLVRAIQGLPRDTEYQYVNPKNSGRIVIHRIQEPEGPIEIVRYNPAKGDSLSTQRIESISTQMIWRMANALVPGKPVNVDRLFGGSYNTRSVLEALVAHTPQFYWCRPGRIELLNTRKKVQPGHKHLIYLPDEPHENGLAPFKDVDMEISEVTLDVVYESVSLDAAPPSKGMTIAEQRRHAQMQIALVLIGHQLGFRTWVAANDHAIKYEGKRLVEFDGVIQNLNSETVLQS